MKAIGFTRYLPIDDAQSLVDVELPRPAPTGRDLLVRVEAVSVNPVDTKVRSPKQQVEAQPKVLGYDAAGVVDAVGDGVTSLKVGDEVWYAGDITRSGSNAQYQLVDERIVSRKPATIDFAQAAALPLTSLTAWELMFQRMRLDPDGADRGRTLLVIGGAGGVGSIATQLARHAGFIVIATASRPETIAWCTQMGATHVIDHRKALKPQLDALGFDDVDAIVNFADPAPYWESMGQLIAPQGRIGLIVEPSATLNIGDPYKAKCISIHWEMMFARARFKTADIGQQQRILERVASLVDAGELRTTLTETLFPIDATNLRTAHAQLESGKTIGKVALSGW